MKTRGGRNPSASRARGSGSPPYPKNSDPNKDARRTVVARAGLPSVFTGCPSAGSPLFTARRSRSFWKARRPTNPARRKMRNINRGEKTGESKDRHKRWTLQRSLQRLRRSAHLRVPACDLLRPPPRRCSAASCRSLLRKSMDFASPIGRGTLEQTGAGNLHLGAGENGKSSDPVRWS